MVRRTAKRARQVDPANIEASDAAPTELASADGGRLTTLARGLNILEFVAKSKRFVRLRDVAEQFGRQRMPQQ